MKRSGKQVIQVACAMLLAVLLSACNESMDDLKNYIASVKTRPAEPIAPIPPVKTYTPYVYAEQTGRNPFHQSIGEETDDADSTQGEGPQPDFNRSKQYLERYELDTLSMVGTFSKEESFWALVSDPEGIIHRVQAGDYIGKNHGQVFNISNVQVSLSELVSDGMGAWIVREASIALGEG